MDSELKEFGVVDSIHVSSENTLQFDAVSAGAAAVVTVILTGFGKALAGKAAEATWSLLLTRFNSTLPAEGKIQVVYRAKAGGIAWELVAEYPNVRALKADRKNHRVYLAIAEGFAIARVPALEERISLLSALPSDVKTRPSELSIRHSA